MSKKKNTLNDLEEFLKIQASSLSTPSSLTEKVTEDFPTQELKNQFPVRNEDVKEDLIEKITEIAQDKRAFYDLIISVTEGLSNKTTEDALLINAALYLKGGTEWKETISNYWKSKK